MPDIVSSLADIVSGDLAPPEPGGTWSIGELAREFGVSLRTLRFYEDKGLLTPTRDGPARTYDAAQRQRLSVILFVKQAGFSLAEIRDVLAIHDRGGPDRTSRLATLFARQLQDMRRRRTEIDAAIAELEHAGRVALRVVPGAQSATQ